MSDLHLTVALITFEGRDMAGYGRDMAGIWRAGGCRARLGGLEAIVGIGAKWVSGRR